MRQPRRYDSLKTKKMLLTETIFIIKILAFTSSNGDSYLFIPYDVPTDSHAINVLFSLEYSSKGNHDLCRRKFSEQQKQHAAHVQAA